jgi:hypothetical protein
VTLDDGIVWMALNRPEQRDTLSLKIHNEMKRALDDLEIENTVGVIALTGEGEALFAGTDKGIFSEDRKRSSRRGSRAATDMVPADALSRPIIALVNGWCFGGTFTRWSHAISPSRRTRRRSACPRSSGVRRAIGFLAERTTGNQYPRIICPSALPADTRQQLMSSLLGMASPPRPTARFRSLIG